MRTIGEMRHVITLLRKVTGDGGDSRVTWETALCARAARREMSGREFAAAGATGYERVVEFTIRTPRDIALDSGLAVLYAGARLECVQVIPDMPKKGFTRLRTVGRGMEGYGIG